MEGKALKLVSTSSSCQPEPQAYTQVNLTLRCFVHMLSPGSSHTLPKVCLHGLTLPTLRALQKVQTHVHVRAHMRMQTRANSLACACSRTLLYRASMHTHVYGCKHKYTLADMLWVPHLQHQHALASSFGTVLLEQAPDGLMPCLLSFRQTLHLQYERVLASSFVNELGFKAGILHS